MKAVQRLNASPLKIPSLGGVARSDGGRGAPGWGSRSTTHTRLSIHGPKNPPEVPPCPRGDAVFIERGAA
jgi:hypothetical protein